MATLSAPTLQNLLTEVRTTLSVKDPNNSYWGAVELTNYLNEAVRVYFSECVLSNEGLFTTQSDLNIVAATETVALPTDCFQVKNLFKKVTNGYVLLPYRNNMTEGYSTQGNGSSESYFPYYEFQSNNIVLRPTPTFSETGGLRIEYIQFPDQMVWGGDALSAQVSPVFKQLLVMYAVYKAKLRESMSNGTAMHKVPEENVAALYKVFKDNISKRSRNPVMVVPFSPETEGY